MGGEYTEEYGDVSELIDVPEGFEAKKQWCNLGKLKNAPKGFTVFRTSGYVELQSDLFEPTARSSFDQGMFIEELDPVEPKMCYTSTLPTFSRSHLEGAVNFCVLAYPKGQPNTLWLGFPGWYDFEVKPKMRLFQKTPRKP